MFQYFDFTGNSEHDRFNRVHHFGTFNANPITAAAGLATLKIVETGKPQKESDALGEILRRKCNEIIKDLGWKGFKEVPKGSYLSYENIDMHFIEIRERQKYLKYGFGRATDQLCIDIRNGVIAREEALRIVKEIDGEVDEVTIKEFCDYLEITRENYNEIMDSFVNHDIFVKDNHGNWKLRNPRT